MSPTVYLSITDSFFLWGSQRKRLVYVDAIFVSVDVPMLYTLSFLTRLFRLNRWRLHNFLFPWTDEYRFLEPRMTIFVFSTNDRNVVCYHTRFCFCRHFQKSGHKPHDNFCSSDKPLLGARKCLCNLKCVSFLMKFFSNQSFWCVCKTF